MRRYKLHKMRLKRALNNFSVTFTDYQRQQVQVPAAVLCHSSQRGHLPPTTHRKRILKCKRETVQYPFFRTGPIVTSSRLQYWHSLPSVKPIKTFYFYRKTVRHHGNVNSGAGQHRCRRVHRVCSYHSSFLESDLIRPMFCECIRKYSTRLVGTLEISGRPSNTANSNVLTSKACCFD